MPIDVIVQNHPERRVAGLWHRGPYNTIADAWKRVAPIAGAAGLFGAGAESLGVFLDDPATVPAAELRSFAGLTLRPGAAVPAGLEEYVVPGGRYATAIHCGGYATLMRTWTMLLHQIQADPKFQPTWEVSMEIYLNDCTQVPEAELRTMVCIGMVSC